ncbi:hypothetical protein [Actinotalea solisilvae]|uniref:hypothetical protein n=1 Tax=Actinotalea solisilvae TaxID=2072922 RepID=UPI0018F20B1E|nr:hypothetical protein [Actinotalea solisilvae]
MDDAASDRTRPAPSAAEPGVRLVVSPRTVLRVLVPVMVALALVSVAGQVLLATTDGVGGALGFLVGLTDVDNERTVPTWFQSVLLAGTGVALWTVGGDARRAGRRRTGYWRLLAAAFVYLSADEALRLHERAMGPLSERFELTGALFFSWVLVAVPLVLVLLGVLVPFLRSLPRRTLGLLLLAGALYVGGSVGIEMVGAVLWSGGLEGSSAYVAVATLEELLEMLGVATLLYAIGRYREDELAVARPAPAVPAGDPVSRAATA